MKKKLLLTLLLLICAVACALGLSSCGGFSSNGGDPYEQPDHDHVFDSVEWIRTSFGHHKECQHDGCRETTVPEEHSDADGDGLCDVCKVDMTIKYLRFDYLNDYNPITGQDKYNCSVSFSSGTPTHITIPEEYLGRPVTEIQDRAFLGCASLTSISIPKTVTTIGGYAFSGCTSLTEITIPKTIFNVGGKAFENCTSLKSISLYSTSIQISYRGVFDGCPIETAELSAKAISEIPQTNLKTVVIIRGNSIDENSLKGCNTLTDIAIPDSIMEIGDSAFEGCTSLAKISIPESVASIGQNAFRDCTSLTEITIPESVTSIGQNAFWNCTLLTEITIPKSVTSIEPSTFRNCTGLKDISIHDGVTLIGGGSFYGCIGLTDIVIPDGVTYIGGSSFYGCTGLKNITLPESVTVIQYEAFKLCSGLENIYFNGDLADWGKINGLYNLLYDYDNLFIGGNKIAGEIVIPENITSIGANAFENCINLTGIVIPDSVTEIGNRAFSGCYNLVEVYNLSSLNIRKGSQDFGYAGYYAIEVYTSREKSKTVKTDDGLIFYSDGDDTYFIGYTGKDTELVLPQNYEGKKYAIHKYAFHGCKNITSITLPDCVTEIDRNLFSDCDNLKYLSTGNGITFIPESMFKDCHSLETVIIGNSVKKICRSAFSNCYGLESIIISDGVTEIAEYAFDGCVTLSNVTFGENIKAIGFNAFGSCQSLTEVYIPDNVEFIGAYAFYNCNNLTSAFIGSGATHIEFESFSYCNNLESLEVSAENSVYHSKNNCIINTETKTLIIGCNNSVIPTDGSVTSIGRNAFSGCRKIASVVISNSITEICGDSFRDCNGLTNITIPDGVTEIGVQSFSGCQNLRMINFTGTVAQWNAIPKGYNWDSGTPAYTVHCSDGDIEKSDN